MLMDANEVIKGIEHFFGNILPKAYCSMDWNGDSITNAFHWAKFCEQIYESYKDKSSKTKLDDLIHHMAGNLHSINQGLCFDDLVKSSSMLHQAFFENPSIENDVVQSIILELKGEHADFENLKLDHDLDSLCYELIEALKPVQLVDSNRSLYHEVKAEVYLNMLKDSTLYMTTEAQVEKYLSDSLEKLCENSNEIELLFHILMLRIPEEVASSVVEVQEFAINWTILKLVSEENCILRDLIWTKLPLLHTLSLRSSEFLNFYLDFLSKCSLSLKCELEDSEMRWIPGSSGTGKVLSFDEILTHFRSLLGNDDDICESTKNYLLNLLDVQPEESVFKEIFCRVT